MLLLLRLKPPARAIWVYSLWVNAGRRVKMQVRSGARHGRPYKSWTQAKERERVDKRLDFLQRQVSMLRSNDRARAQRELHDAAHAEDCDID